MQPPSPLFAFHFLFQEVSALRAALATVLAAPHQVLADSPTHVPIHEAAEVGPEVLIGMLQAPDSWVETRGLPFTQQLKQCAPSHVWQRRPKVLPKFHGSRGKLEAPLRAVLAWCVNPIAPDVAPIVAELDQCESGNAAMQILNQQQQIAQYPNTAARVARMAWALYTDGFASFG